MTTPDEQIMMISLLPGLEEARRAIDEKIAAIKAVIAGQPVPKKTSALASSPFKKRRVISEEVREQRRKILAQAREKKLELLRKAKEQEKGEEPKEAPQNGVTGKKSPIAAGTKGHAA